ncbi:MAG: hypothetical protein ACLR8P_00190 [Clostridium fessum]
MKHECETDMAGEISAAAAHLPAEKALRWSYFLAPAGEETCVRVLRELKMDNGTIDKAKILQAVLHSCRWNRRKALSATR